MAGLEGLLTGHTLVKRYTIEEVIGRGGFAVVYRAMDERLSRPVAVKVITLSAADPQQREVMRQRLHKEAQAAASLPHHPNLVTVHDVGTDPELGLDFLVMEMLRGENLAQYLARAGKPPLKRALCILRDAAEGLAIGHRAGLIHRDVKPGNIFLADAHDGNRDDVRVCVLDYGIAQAIEDDQTVTRGMGANPLSPAFASPEQIRGARDLTAATDVFSLGVVGYQLLTGERPFTSEPGQVPTGWTVRRPLRELNPQVSPEVEQVVMKAMSVDAGDRYPDADAFSQALQAATHRDLKTQVHSALSHIAIPADEYEDDATMVAPVRAAAIPVVPPRKVDGHDGETVIAPAAAPAARPTARPAAHVSHAAHTVPPPSTARPSRRWPVILAVALLLVAAAAWAALSGGGDDQPASSAASGETAGEPIAGAGEDAGGDEVQGATPIPPRDGYGVGGGGSDQVPGGEGSTPASSNPSSGEPRPSAGESQPSGESPGVQRPEPQPQRPPATQPQPQPQPQRPSVPAARPEPQQPQPSRPPVRQRPPAQQPPVQQQPPAQQPPAQQPPQQQPPQPEPQPPIQQQPPPVQPQPEPEPPVIFIPAQPRPEAPRDTLRIGFPPR